MVASLQVVVKKARLVVVEVIASRCSVVFPLWGGGEGPAFLLVPRHTVVQLHVMQIMQLERVVFGFWVMAPLDQSRGRLLFFGGF